MRVDPEQIITHQWFNRAVARRIIFRDKRPEHSIPKHKNSGVIFVEIVVVRAVMNAVMRRRVKNIFKPRGQFANDFGVNPELIKQI